MTILQWAAAGLVSWVPLRPRVDGLGGRQEVVALTVVSEVERNAGDECGVCAELVVLSVIVPCSALLVLAVVSGLVT